MTTHGTGALNIDGARIATDWAADRCETWLRSGRQAQVDDQWQGPGVKAEGSTVADRVSPLGRWPANVLLDEEAAGMLDAMTGELVSGKMEPTRVENKRTIFGGDAKDGYTTIETYGDRGGASRFFYTSKSSRREREAGVDVEPSRRSDAATRDEAAPGSNNPRLRVSERHNDHPTVKPVDLMRWLCRLVTPPGGVILDPFLGSGTTALAALDEGFSSIGIEREERYMEIAQDRIVHRHLLEVETVEAHEMEPQGRLL